METFLDFLRAVAHGGGVRKRFRTRFAIPAGFLPVMVSLFLLACGAMVGRAQMPDNRSMLTNEIRNFRTRLAYQQPTVSPAVLDELADKLGRSNYVSFRLTGAISGNATNGIAELLDLVPGMIDDLRPYGEPLMTTVARQGSLPALDMLIARKADVNRTNQFGQTPLCVAMQSSRWSHALRLVEAGANITNGGCNGMDPLEQVANGWWNGRSQTDPQAQLLIKLLEKGADPFTSERNPPGRSILESVLDRSPGWAGELMLTNQPSPDRRTPVGDTALHLAAERGMTNDVEFLLAAGFPVDQTNSEGLTVLQSVVSHSQPGAFQMVTNIHSSGGTVFMGGPMAFSRGPWGRVTAPPMVIAQLLLAHGAKLDVWSAAGMHLTNELAGMFKTNASLVNARDGEGRTPLHYAVLTAQSFMPQTFIRISGTGQLMQPGMMQSIPFQPRWSTPPNAAEMLLAAGADVSAATTKPSTRISYENPIAAGSTPLHVAAIRGNESLIGLLLKAGAKAAQAEDEGNTALHLAARIAPTNSLAMLLKAGAPMNATNHGGFTPLRMAVENGNAANADFLLSAGAGPEIGLAGTTQYRVSTGQQGGFIAVDIPGNTTLLHIAAGRGDAAMIKVLLQHKLSVEARDAKGETPLMQAARVFNWDTLNLLVRSGANINAADNAGDTALHQVSAGQQDDIGHMTDLTWWDRTGQSWLTTPGYRKSAMTNLMTWGVLPAPRAATWTNTSLTAWLIEHHANPNLTNKQGLTPLGILLGQQWLIYDPNHGTNRIAALIKGGARVDIAGAHGETALHIVAGRGTPEMLFLVARSAPNPAVLDSAGRTALHMAARNFTEANQCFAATNTALLLSLGANPNARDNFGLTPLHYAVTNRHSERVQAAQVLLAHHADPNARDSMGRTPLLLLAREIRQEGDYFENCEEALEALLKGGADPTITDHNGQTFLHYWCEQGRSHSGNLDEILRKLLHSRPELTKLTNSAGDTLLHAAVRADDDTAVRLLLECGVDPAARNAHGETPIYLAAKHNEGGIANRVHPQGVDTGFYWTIVTRNREGFEVYLKAEPALAKITFNNQETALMAATAHRTPREFAARLLELGAPLDPVSALRLDRMEDFRRLISGGTNLTSSLLFEAVNLRHFAEIEDLAVTYGDLHALDGLGHTLFYQATFSRQTNVANWLRDHYVTPTFCDAVGLDDTNLMASFLSTNRALANSKCGNIEPVLLLAASLKRTDAARCLLANGAKVDAADGTGTALHVACFSGATAVARELLLAGAVQSRVRGIAPVHTAAANGHADIVELLLEHGADVNARQEPDSLGGGNIMPNGATPLHWAVNLGRTDVVKLLLKRGADVNAINAKGETPLDLVPAGPRSHNYPYVMPALPLSIGPPASRTKAWPEIEAALKEAGGVRKWTGAAQ